MGAAGIAALGGCCCCCCCHPPAIAPKALGDCIWLVPKAFGVCMLEACDGQGAPEGPMPMPILPIIAGCCCICCICCICCGICCIWCGIMPAPALALPTPKGSYGLGVC